MKVITVTLIMIFAYFSASAQQIWTEGTTWEIRTEYPDLSGEMKTEVYTYELGAPVSFNDTLYYTLTETYEGVTHIVSYLRAEGDDEYVYARHFQSEELGIYTGEQSEILLYDFSKPFEYGDIIQFGAYGGYILYYYIDPKSSDELRYFYDVIEPGDCLPAYHDIIYKIGFFYGPINSLFADLEGPVGPNPKNVSHVLFKTKGKPNGSVITLSIDVLRADKPPYTYYRLSGSRINNAEKQPLFKKGNVIFCQ